MINAATPPEPAPDPSWPQPLAIVLTTADGLPRLAFSELEAAKMLGVCGKTLANARRKGRIGFRREGTRVLYAVDDLFAFLKTIKVIPDGV